MKGFLKYILLPSALLSLVACGGSSGSGAAGAATTFSLSGTMSGLTATTTLLANEMSAMDYAKYYAALSVGKIQPKSGSGRGDSDVSSLSNQCADGSYYRVLCTSWSVPPIAAYGEVSCSGGSSGAFTVTGLPLNSEISCFVRKSSDGTTFKPFKSIELPATGSLSGGTDTITSSGDMALSLAVGANNSLTVTVTSGDNKSDDSLSSSTSDSAALSGFYVISCDAAGNTTEQMTLCKCFMDDSGNKETCIANSAAGISDVKMPVDINIYSGVVNGNHDFNGDSVNDLTNGQSIQGVTVWQATGTCSSTSNCTSSRGSGGDGATHFNVINFNGSNASTVTNPVAWETGSGFSCGSGCTFTIGSVPANNASQATWFAWLTSMIDSAGASTYSCNHWDSNSYTGNNIKTKANCIGNFVWQTYESLSRQSRLPRIRFNMCAGGTCSETPSAAMLEVEGIHFSGGVAGTDSPGAQPGQQYVFEQWKPLSNGAGGTFSQSHEDRRWVACLSGSGTDSQSGVYGCPGSAGGIECMGRNDMSMKLLPTSTTGVYNMGFSNSTTYNYGVIRGGTYDGKSTDGTSFNASSKCVSAYGASDSFFVAKGTKL